MKRLLFAFSVCFAAVLAAGEARFSSAVPVWPGGRAWQTNAFVGFRSDFTVRPGEKPVLRLAAAMTYRAWVNGRFVGIGPVRAGHGYFRVDEWPLDKMLVAGTNTVAVEVRAYNLYGGGVLGMSMQPGFLQAEVVTEKRTLCATGRDFTTVDIPNVKNVCRWSAQRAFIEAYQVTNGWLDWRTLPGFCGEKPSVQPAGRLLERVISYPKFKTQVAKPVFTTEFGFDAKRPPADPELALDGRDVIARITGTKSTPAPADAIRFEVGSGKGVVFSFGREVAGMPALMVRCVRPGVLWCVMDEALTREGTVDPIKRFRHPLCFALDLKEPGEYRFEAFEPTALVYLHAFMTSGSAEVGDVWLREYVHPAPYAAMFESSDSDLNRVFAAARETCAQNTMDAMLDCPSRERNSCPADSFFVNEGFSLLAGSHEVERVFFENYQYSTNYPGTYEGWLPSYYPGDAPRDMYGNIWSHVGWIAVQLERYLSETGDRELVDALRPRILSAIDALRPYRDATGLIVDAPGWTWVGWGPGEEHRNGLSYMANMSYLAALEATSRLYGLEAYSVEARSVRAALLGRSWNGQFFFDRPAEAMATEGCQAYAFMFGLVTRNTHPDFWRFFVDELGPGRKEGAYPEILPAELCYGGVLRTELLSAAGQDRRVLADIKCYYSRMAKKTGTLWEGWDEHGANSLSHGFNSGVVQAIAASALGLRSVDWRSRTVVFRVGDTDLKHCRGSFPTAEGPIRASWTREGDGHVHETLELPSGWTRAPVSRGESSQPRIADVPNASEIGRPLPAWRKGELDLHFVYTGTGENQFWIFPDGTTVVCDTGDYNTPERRAEMPLLPSGERTGGEWMSRYIKSVTPTRDRLDYMLVSHWHSDHCGELNYAYTTQDGRKTSGLTTVGEFFRVGTFIDHQFPESNRYGVGEDHVVKLIREYVAQARANDGMVQEPFKVGSNRQIVLRHDPEGVYSRDFEVRNICANGVIWTGRGETTEDLLSEHVVANGVKGFNENQLSAALVIRYGDFRYYTGGDVCGSFVDAKGKLVDYEARVGSVVGRVDVCKANHHAWKGTMCPSFVRSVGAAAYVINLWCPDQIQDEQMSTMTSRLYTQGPRYIFPTFIPQCAKRDFAGRPWWQDVSSACGHVVVRVAPGGVTYRIYVLDAHDERRTVLATYAGRPL